MRPRDTQALGVQRSCMFWPANNRKNLRHARQMSGVQTADRTASDNGNALDQTAAVFIADSAIAAIAVLFASVRLHAEPGVPMRFREVNSIEQTASRVMRVPNDNSGRIKCVLQGCANRVNWSGAAFTHSLCAVIRERRWRFNMPI